MSKRSRPPDPALPAESSMSASAQCRRCGQADPGGQCPRCGLFQPGNTLGRRFEQGNALQLRHGARAGVDLASQTDQALEEIVEVLGDGPGSEPRYSFARAHAASALARVRLLEAHVERVGLLDGKSRPRPVLKTLQEATAALQRWLEALGMTPASAARLGVDLTRAKAMTLAEKMAAERRSDERKD